MDYLTFFASIIGSLVKLAWPAAAFGAAWIFRDKVADLLPLLKFKYKDLDVSFRFDQAEKEAAKLQPIPGSPEAPPTPEEKSKFEQIAKLSPRAALLEARTNLEEAVRSFGQKAGVSNMRPYMNYANLVRTLRQRHLIDGNTSALLDDLRAIGNAAAHNASDPSEEDALRFRTLADTVIGQLGNTSE